MVLWRYNRWESLEEGECWRVSGGIGLCDLYEGD